MTINQFIEKAEEGGWYKEMKPKLIEVKIEPEPFAYFKTIGGKEKISVSMILLSKKAWEAVGKVEMWKDNEWIAYDYGQATSIEGWRYNMHRMIDALAKGESIENFLKTL